MKCPFCDFENPSGVTACGFCGAFLPSEEAETTKGDESILDRSAGRQIRCSYCWKINSATNEVCEECGMPLAYVPHPEQEGRSRKLLTRGQVWNPVPEGMVRCLGCWHDNPEGTILCEKCGVKLMKPAETPDYFLIKSQPSRPVVGYSARDYRDEQAQAIGEALSMMAKAARLDAREKHICLYRDGVEFILTQSNGQKVIPNHELYGYGGDAYVIVKNQQALQAHRTDCH